MTADDARLYELLGDIRAEVGRIAERCERNTETLDCIGNRLSGYEQRLRSLERIADRGRGALQLALWIGGAVAALVTMLAMLGDWVADAARSLGKGG